MWRKTQLLNVKLDLVNKYQALDIVSDLFSEKQSSLICTVNSEFVTRALRDENFSHLLNNKSALNLVDGYGIVWGFVLCNSWKPNLQFMKQIYVVLQWMAAIIFYPLIILFVRRSIPRVSGSDFIWDLAKWSSSNQKSIFLLGNRYGLDPNVLEKTSLELQTKFYDLKIAGTYSGSWEEAEEKEIIAAIKSSDADILFCGFGSPAQENWMARNLHKTGAKIGIGLGGSFDFISGAQKRAPRWMQISGLEWFYRLIKNPRRIKRQFSLISFLFKILSSRLR